MRVMELKKSIESLNRQQLYRRRYRLFLGLIMALVPYFVSDNNILIKQGQ